VGLERVRKRPDVLASPAGMSCELTTEGVRARWIGVTPSQQCGPHGSWRWPVSCAAKADLALTCRSSVGVAPARVVTLPVALSEGASTSSGTTPSGSRRSAAVLVDRNGRRNRRRRSAVHRASGNAGYPDDERRSGSRKRAPFDEAAGGGGPGSSARERDRGRQRSGSRPLSRQKTPGRRSVARRARDHELTGPSELGSPGNRGQSCTRAEAMGSPSSEASLDHALRQGFDRAGGVEATLTGESRWGR